MNDLFIWSLSSSTAFGACSSQMCGSVASLQVLNTDPSAWAAVIQTCVWHCAPGAGKRQTGCTATVHMWPTASVDQMQAFAALTSSQYFSLSLYPIGGMFHTHPLYHPLCSLSFPHDRGSSCLLSVLFHPLPISRSSLPCSLIWRFHISFNLSPPLMCSALFFLSII